MSADASEVVMDNLDGEEKKGAETAAEPDEAPRQVTVAVKDLGPQEVHLPQGEGPLFLQWPMFWFPYQVNEFAAQCIGIQVTLTVLALVVYRHVEADHTWTPYVTLCLFIDYMLRFFAGGNASFYGSNGAIVAKVLNKKEMVPGAQKQFASFAGAFLSGLATLSYFKEDDGAAGTVLLSILLFCAACEGFLNFCFGCWMYGYFRDSPTVKKMIRTIYGWEHDLHDEYVKTTDYAWRTDLPAHAGAFELKTVTREYQGEENSVFLHYKVKNDDDRRVDHQFVKYCHIDYFTMPMSLSALAVAFFFQREGQAYANLQMPANQWKGTAYFASVVFVLFLVLYLLKCLFYWNKVLKEWNHPVKRNFFSAIPITFMILMYLMRSQDISTGNEDQTKVNFVQFIWWIVAAAQIWFGVSVAARWVKEPQTHDLLDASWMFPPVGNLVSALTIKTCAGNAYAEDGWFFFAFGLYFWVVMSAIIFGRLMFRAPVTAAATPGTLTFVAAPAVASLAYTTLASYDSFARTLFWTAVALFLVFAYLGCLNYFGRSKWDMSWWAYVFPIVTIAMAGSSNHAVVDNNRSKNILYISLGISSGMTLIFISQTLLSFVMHSSFVPKEKWGPLSFMKMVHYAFREAIKKATAMNALLKTAIKNGNEISDQELISFTELFDDFALVHSAHSVHEDKVVFRAYSQWFPDHPTPSNEDHERDHALLQQMEGLVAQLEAADKKDNNLRLKLLGEVVPRLEAFLHTLSHHLDGEESHLNPIGTKYINIEWQKELVRQCWEITPVEDWVRILPFVVKHQFIHKRRVRFLQALRWAVPEKIQLIGRLLHQGLDKLTWHRVVSDIPEMIPRHVQGYTRLY